MTPTRRVPFLSPAGKSRKNVPVDGTTRRRLAWRPACRRLLLLLMLAGCTLSCERHLKGPDPATTLFLPDDLEATLWAASPLFYNPTNIDVDSKGRIWITEAVNYRNFNNDSTRALHHSKGDRVVILEDLNGDGRADVSKVFVQDKDLVSPVGLAVIGNRVFVSCSPNLIVYTDHNGDDVPDEKEVLLTGFGGLDHDHSLHAVIGGPDGRLYFNTGNAGPHKVTDRSGWTLRSGSVYTGGSPYNTRNEGNMKSDDGRVWVGGLALRMDPDGKNLKVLAHNFRNSFELAVDSRGDMWQNDNDDQVVACRTSWLMEGGNAGYFSTDGTRFWQADQRPWQDVFTAHWHQDDPGVMPAGDNAGAGSPTGVVVNEGDGLGSKYRGMLLSADAGRNVIFAYHPSKLKSGYNLGERLSFITSLKEDNVGYVWNDTVHKTQSEKWFRPSDVAVGTDGALYVADWYDPVVGGHQMQDTTGYGRIYRIVPKNTNPEIPALDLGTRDGQLKAFRNPAVNVRYTALMKLREQGASVLPEVKKLLSDENPYVQARAIWLMSQLGAEGIVSVRALLEHHDADVRVVAFRALRAAGEEIMPLVESCMVDTSSFLRREVLAALAALPFEKRKKALLTLMDGFDGTDRWYLEAFGAAAAGHEDVFYPEIIAKYNLSATAPARWDPRAVSLLWRLHPPASVATLGRLASDAGADFSSREKAITALAFISTREAVQAMLRLTRDPDSRVAEQAKYWIGFRQGNDWHALWDWGRAGIDGEHERRLNAMKVRRNRILDDRMPLPEKKWNARDMAQDSLGVQMLLGMVADGQISDPLQAHVRELLDKVSDPLVRARVSVLYGDGAAQEYSVPAIVNQKGNPEAGASLATRHCAGCHRIGPDGSDIGPDLSKINRKFDRAAIVDAIIDPNAGIVFGYETWFIHLHDGQSYFGFLIGDGPKAVTLKALSGEKHVIPVSKIRARQKQEKSLMPPAQALGLTDQELADISAYLMSLP